MSAASPGRPPRRAVAGALAAGQPGTSPSQASIARLGLRGVIALLEQSPDGVVVCRADDRCYVYANPVACRLMGYRFGELLGRDLLMNFPEREHPAVLARFPGQPGQWTGVLALPDGTERQVTWSSALFRAGPTSSSCMPAARSCSPTGGSCSPRTRSSIRCSKPWNRWTGRHACTCS